MISVTEKLKETQRKLEERSLIASAKSGKSVGKVIKVSNNDGQISRSLSKTTSLTSRSLFTSSANSRREMNTVVDRSQRSSRNKSIVTLSKLSGLKPITEENDKSLKTNSQDAKSQNSLRNISSSLTHNSKSEKLSKVGSQMASSRILASSSRDVSVNKSLSSLTKRSVSEKRTTVITPSVTKSHVSLEKDTVSNGSSFRNKSVISKSPVSLSHESNAKKSQTVIRNKSQDTSKSTVLSRKSSITTRISVTNVSKSPQNSSLSVNTNAKKDQKVDSNGIDRIYSFRNEELTGKTFFSESGKSHQDTSSRPASIRSKISRNGSRS